MSDIAIKVENLSKLYRIGAKQESYKTLRDSLTEAVAAPFRRIFNSQSEIPGPCSEEQTSLGRIPKLGHLSLPFALSFCAKLP